MCSRHEERSVAVNATTRHQLFNFAAVAIMPCTSLSIAERTASTSACGTLATRVSLPANDRAAAIAC